MLFRNQFQANKILTADIEQAMRKDGSGPAGIFQQGFAAACVADFQPGHLFVFVRVHHVLTWQSEFSAHGMLRFMICFRMIEWATTP